MSTLVAEDAEQSSESAPNDSKGSFGFAGRVRSAVIWNAGFNLFRDVLQFLQMMVLARLVAEEAYGQFAFVMSVVGFLSIFSAAPFLTYTLQVKSDQDLHYQDHFSASAVLQFAMFLLTNLIGLALAELPKYAAAAPLVHVLSLTFLLEWTCEFRRKMIERAFDFRTLRLLHGAGLIAGTLSAISMAGMGLGAYALVVPGMLVTLPFIWDLFLRQGWTPTWEFSWEKYKPAFHFGLTRIASGLSVQGRSLLEASFLTAVIGFGPLGILNRAVGLANLACTKVASQLMYAIYPVLTRLEKETGQAERAGNLVLRLVAWSAIPAAASLVWLAAPVVETVYGSKWSSVIPLLKWTMISAVLSALVHVGYTLVLARNRSRLCFICDISSLIGTGIGLVLILPWGVVPYLIAASVVNAVNLLVLMRTLMTERAVTSGGLVNALLPAVSSSVIGVLIACLVAHVTANPPETFASAALWGCVFGLVYLAALRLVFTAALLEIVSFSPGRKHLQRLLYLSPD